MKVKISFELDLKNTAYNISNEKLIDVCLQNLGSWFNSLHQHNLFRRIDAMCARTDCERTKKALRQHADEDTRLSEQLFYNYSVEGITDNGKHFIFTHQEPGYKENLTIK